MGAFPVVFLLFAVVLRISEDCGVTFNGVFSVFVSLTLGSKLNKVYSHSTMNLSSMANDTGNSGTLTVRKSSR